MDYPAGRFTWDSGCKSLRHFKPSPEFVHLRVLRNGYRCAGLEKQLQASINTRRFSR
jgi:hypothetical protein